MLQLIELFFVQYNRVDGGGSRVDEASTDCICMIRRISLLVKELFGSDGEDGTIPSRRPQWWLNHLWSHLTQQRRQVQIENKHLQASWQSQQTNILRKYVKKTLTWKVLKLIRLFMFLSFCEGRVWFGLRWFNHNHSKMFTIYSVNHSCCLLYFFLFKL